MRKSLFFIFLILSIQIFSVSASATTWDFSGSFGDWYQSGSNWKTSNYYIYSTSGGSVYNNDSTPYNYFEVRFRTNYSGLFTQIFYYFKVNNSIGGNDAYIAYRSSSADILINDGLNQTTLISGIGFNGNLWYTIKVDPMNSTWNRYRAYDELGNLVATKYLYNTSKAYCCPTMELNGNNKGDVDYILAEQTSYSELPGSNNISFDEANYSMGDTATISYQIANPDFYTYYYLAELENPSGEVISTSAMSIGSSNPNSFSYALNSPGTWRAHLWQCQLSNSECNVFLGYDTANVSSSTAGQGGSIYFYSDILETNLITSIDNGNTAYMKVAVSNIDTSRYVYEVLITDPDGIGVDKENVIVSPQSFIVDTSYPFYIRSGAYRFRLVATDIIYGGSQILANAYLSILDDYPGSGQLNFSKNNYSLGEQVNISWNIGQGNFSKYAYSIELYGSDNTLQSVTGLNSATGTISPQHDKTKTGSFSAWLYAQKYGSVSRQLMKIATTQYGSVSGGVSGNLSLDKSTYNRTENVQIYYNITTSGRINIQTPTTMYTYAVNAGTGQQKTFYIPQDASFGTYTVYLEYFDGTFWTYIDHETFTVTYIGQNMIEFSDPRKIYIQGDTMIVNAIGTESGYIKITDSNGMIKLNSTISANSLTSYNYYVAFTDPAGIWTAKLYNSTGVEVASDSADVYTSGYGQPSPTATVPSVTSTSGTIDYVGNKTARKQAENSFLNTFYGGMNALFTLAILATIMFLLKDMSKWR